MACRTTQELQTIQDELDITDAMIAALKAGIVKGPMSGTISYIFDSGTGRQQEKFVSPMEAKNVMQGLFATKRTLERMKSGQSLTSQRLRR